MKHSSSPCTDLAIRTGFYPKRKVLTSRAQFESLRMSVRDKATGMVYRPSKLGRIRYHQAIQFRVIRSRRGYFLDKLSTISRGRSQQRSQYVPHLEPTLGTDHRLELSWQELSGS